MINRPLMIHFRLEKQIILLESNETHEKITIRFEKHENNENLKTPFENYKNQ